MQSSRRTKPRAENKMKKVTISIVFMMVAVVNVSSVSAADGGITVTSTNTAVATDLNERRATRAYKKFLAVYLAGITGDKLIEVGSKHERELLVLLEKWMLDNTRNYIHDLDGWAIAYFQGDHPDAIEWRLVSKPGPDYDPVEGVTIIVPAEVYADWDAVAKHAPSQPPAEWAAVLGTMERAVEEYAQSI